MNSDLFRRLHIQVCEITSSMLQKAGGPHPIGSVLCEMGFSYLKGICNGDFNERGLSWGGVPFQPRTKTDPRISLFSVKIRASL